MQTATTNETTLYFGAFRFSLQDRLLYNNDALLPLNRNQTELLVIFLNKPNVIHSKDQILDAVWGQQVVSEQVVFQTISQLRNILGAGVIKTFSKKGYQWQLAISECAPEKSAEGLTVSREPIVSSGLPPKSFNLLKNWQLSALLLLICVLGLTLFLPAPKPVADINLLMTTDSNPDEQGIIKHALQGLFGTDINSSKIALSSDQAFAAPSRAVSESRPGTSKWLIWGRVESLEPVAIFHYGLASEAFSWEGYLHASDVSLLPELLEKRLSELSKMDLFNRKSLTLNDVLMLLKEQPEEPDLLLLAAEFYQHSEQYDVALSYLQRVLRHSESVSSVAYTAVAHWMAGRIYKIRGQTLQSHNSLNAMYRVLKGIPVGPLHLHHIKTRAWLAYSEEDHDTMYATLDNGIELFGKTPDIAPLLKFKLHVLYSILAQKVQNPVKQYFHLSQAQALLLKHQLDESNLASVYFHMALFARAEVSGGQTNQSIELASENGSFETDLKRVLTLPRTSDNYWVLDSALEILVGHYVDKQRFQEAESLLDKSTDTPARQLLRAEVLLQQNQSSVAILWLEKAFEQARIDHDIRTAISSALHLYRLSANNTKAQAEYLAYLEANARQEWLEANLALVNHQ